MIDCHSSNITKLKKKQKQKQGVCHTSALLFTLKSILRQKKKSIMETQIFHHAKT